MAITITIDDGDLLGFSDHAKDQLQKSLQQHSIEFLAEVNRIESGQNAAKGTPEITKTMVELATITSRNTALSPRKRSKMRIFLSITSSLSALVTGMMYDSERLRDPFYMTIFMIVFATTVVTVIASAWRD
ncbi:hypothetical protein QBK99_07825 [Corticibacterium sp. UT-5YL-CI-8]|nr:hypothetical protein [Tianweitania sp. UT-5YL-CI-8]